MRVGQSNCRLQIVGERTGTVRLGGHTIHASASASVYAQRHGLAPLGLCFGVDDSLPISEASIVLQCLNPVG